MARLRDTQRKEDVRDGVEIKEVGVDTRDEGVALPDAGQQPSDPLSVFLSDPGSHLSDILYLKFRIYKKKLLWSFMQTAHAELHLDRFAGLFIADRRIDGVRCNVSLAKADPKLPRTATVRSGKPLSGGRRSKVDCWGAADAGKGIGVTANRLRILSPSAGGEPAAPRGRSFRILRPRGSSDPLRRQSGDASHTPVNANSSCLRRTQNTLF